MPEGPTIIIKKHRDVRKMGHRAFFHPTMDKNSQGHWVNKPAHLYPRMVEDLRNRVDSTRKAASGGFINQEHEGAVMESLRKDEEKLSKIEESIENQEAILKHDKDFLMKSIEQERDLIRDLTPRRKITREKRISAHTIERRERTPVDSPLAKDLETGKQMTFKEFKQAHIVKCRALGVDSNIAHLDRD